MHEVAVGRAVRCHHAHLRFGHRGRVRDLRQHHGHARTQHDSELPPSYYQTESFVVLPIFLKMVLITHIRSLSPDCAVDRTRTATFYTRIRSRVDAFDAVDLSRTCL